MRFQDNEVLTLNPSDSKLLDQIRNLLNQHELATGDIVGCLVELDDHREFEWNGDIMELREVVNQQR